jgi:WWE domain
MPPTRRRISSQGISREEIEKEEIEKETEKGEKGTNKSVKKQKTSGLEKEEKEKKTSGLKKEAKEKNEQNEEKEEKEEDNVQRLWEWAGDSNKGSQDKWIKYSKEISAKLEEAYQRQGMCKKIIGEEGNGKRVCNDGQ